MRCQAILYMAMFRYKKDTAIKYSRTLNEHFKVENKNLLYFERAKVGSNTRLNLTKQLSNLGLRVLTVQLERCHLLERCLSECFLLREVQHGLCTKSAPKSCPPFVKKFSWVVPRLNLDFKSMELLWRYILNAYSVTYRLPMTNNRLIGGHYVKWYSREHCYKPTWRTTGNNWQWHHYLWVMACVAPVRASEWTGGGTLFQVQKSILWSCALCVELHIAGCCVTFLVLLLESSEYRHITSSTTGWKTPIVIWEAYDVIKKAYLIGYTSSISIFVPSPPLNPVLCLLLLRCI